ncbi:MAG: DNA primase [Thermoanaerobaculia bacterium]|nr:DNA primase [Thermoanaerobaculia bacterium]
MNGQITPDVVQSVRDAVDIVDIASLLTTLRPKGKRHEGLCPFHKEKTPSFSVDPEQGLYYCFGCGAGGDAIKLWMEHSGDEFPEAIEALARRYGIPLPEKRGTGTHAETRRDLTKVLEVAQNWFQRQLERSDFARGYLDERRIPADLRRRFGLGFAPDGWHNLLDDLRRRVSEKDLLDAGLVGRSEKTGNLYDRFRLRLMFPIHAASGRLVGFGGRTLGDDRAKYVNTAETEAFHKGRLLYGLNLAKRAIRDTGRAVLAEGYFDVIGLAAAGIDEAVAGMGTSLTEEQAKLLARYSDRVVLAYDGDDAGGEAARRALPILLRTRLSVKQAPFPAGHDPDSLRLERGAEVVRKLVEDAYDAVWAEVERLTPRESRHNPTTQAAAAREATGFLAGIPDAIVRDGYSRRAAQRLDVPEQVLLRRRGAEDFGRTAHRRVDVRTEEEKALQLLLSDGVRLPEPKDLPPSDVFFDEDCRNIFVAFCDLYRSGGCVPSGRDVVTELSRSGRNLDAAARVLLESSAAEGGRVALVETLGRLQKRWLQRRQKELPREIRDAESQGDTARLEQLLEEKKTLSRHLHPQMTGRLY